MYIERKLTFSASVIFQLSNDQPSGISVSGAHRGEEEMGALCHGPRFNIEFVIKLLSCS